MPDNKRAVHIVQGWRYGVGEGTSDTKVEILRFVIDLYFQNKGLGRAALQLAITESHM